MTYAGGNAVSAAARKLALALLAGFILQATAWGQTRAGSSNADAPASSPSRNRLLDEANDDTVHGRYDKAIGEITLAIQMNDKDAGAYEMRGEMYCSMKLWDKAERDYTTADKISPDPSYKYKLGEIQYVQKNYDDARPYYAGLASDPNLGELARYRIFLCDLFGSHEGIAMEDLAVIDREPKSAGHFYAHAAYGFYHGDRDNANRMLNAADKLFDQSTKERYVLALVEAQNFYTDMATFKTKDGRNFVQTRIFAEGNSLRALTQAGWISIPFNELPDDLSPFPEKVRVKIAQNRLRDSVIAPSTSVVSFITKSGAAYRNVRWLAQDDGLSILTSDGWILIPYDQLPEDRSAFSKDLQDALQKETASSTASSFVESVSFTTRDGRTYSDIRARPTDDGIAVLTADGWTSIPGSNLPTDLSPFPAGWRDQLRAAATSSSSVQPSFITFTTKSGKHFDEVRAAIEDGGLRVTSPDGLLHVPWKDVPDDLAAFPATWREKIAAAKKEDAAAPHTAATP